MLLLENRLPGLLDRIDLKGPKRYLPILKVKAFHPRPTRIRRACLWDSPGRCVGHSCKEVPNVMRNSTARNDNLKDNIDKGLVSSFAIMKPVEAVP